MDQTEQRVKMGLHSIYAALHELLDEALRYIDVLKRGLKVMDATAVSLCMDNNLPIIVFNLKKAGNIRRAVCGEEIGTLVTGS